MNLLKVSNPLMKWLYMMLKLTGIWWLYNLPYIFLGVNLLAAKDVEAVHTIVITGICLLPFAAVPSTAAALAIARKYLKGDGEFPFFHSFWHYYKREYKKSVVLGLLNVALLIVFYLALRYYAELSALLAVFFYLLLVLTPFFFLYVCSYLVDQELPLKGYLINAFYLLIMHPLNTTLMVTVVLASGYFLWAALPPLLILIMPGLVAFTMTYFYQKSMAAEIKKSSALSN
ncbi:DUF624 domain-containing protein [Mesobacillus foraminis]|uniref:YesL family protein n=1 Tax=Mesobacillus foraminis TaxID=279826 RepID=UPI001BE8B815|nr:DUF624 domain-containing protein [Mesobacillus foraminis]MBT2755843.1 DUF624 domain-containing protein [Mesobacillus foraminis]